MCHHCAPQLVLANDLYVVVLIFFNFAVPGGHRSTGEVLTSPLLSHTLILIWNTLTQNTGAGNMCKAICGVAAGAVGGVFNLHWARGSDIADIQAKFGAQHTVTGSLGLLFAYLFVQSVAHIDPTRVWALVHDTHGRTFVCQYAMHENNCF
jgi:hypothetical protein